jgi:predicted esterase
LLPHQLTEQASALLDELGVPNKSHILPGLAHSIDQRGIQIGTAFLQVVLPSS